MITESGKEPPPDTLRQQLDIQWRDHFQTREQTWKALQMVAALLVAYVGSGLKVDNPAFIWAGGIVCILGASFGIAMTIHHRKVQIQKMLFIWRLEKMLGLHQDDILGKLNPPRLFRLASIFDFREVRTPTFILLAHLAFLLFAVVYMVARS